MGEFEIFLSYVTRSSFITIFVLLWLSAYFIITFTILISRQIGLSSWHKNEQKALENLLLGAKVNSVNSILKKCVSGEFCRQKIDLCISIAEKKATSGLTWLAIIASTSPFIGLFGTVISILDTFSKLGGAGNSSLAVIAPAISEALVATGCGIFVAIPAYTFNLIIKRKSYELMNTIRREAEIILLMQKGKTADKSQNSSDSENLDVRF